MNPDPPRILTSQRPPSVHVSDQDNVSRLSRQSAAVDDAPPLPLPAPNVQGVKGSVVQAGQLLNDGPRAGEEPDSGNAVPSAADVNAADHLDTEPPLAIPSPGTSQLEAVVEHTISSLSTSVHAPDGQSIPSSELSSFPPFRPPMATPRPAYTLKHSGSQSPSEPPLKKRRPELNRRHTLDPPSFPRGVTPTLNPTPSPPLQSPTKQRPTIPARPSTSHTIAAIRNKIREDLKGITTLKLARGSVGRSSPQHSTNMPGNLVSLEKSTASPGSERGHKSGLELLANVGIIELLEQDERPTFIIDVSNPANFTPGGPLQIIFANASLRAHEVSVSNLALSQITQYRDVANIPNSPY
jgi:hypothetical protein